MDRVSRGIALAGLGVLVAHGLLTTSANARTKRAIARLGAGPSEPSPESNVPALVREAALSAVGRVPTPLRVQLRQHGEMRLSERGAWRPFTAIQTIGVTKPGFVWVARTTVLPLVKVLVTDAFTDGTGWLEARLFGSLPLARSSGAATDLGELMRYLAELPWAPHALLHNRRLSFRQIDGNSVEVSAPCADGRARVRLVLAGTGIVRIEADDRPRVEGGRIVPRPWAGRFAEWREFGGVRLPTRAEVSWILPTGPFDCWRGEITDWNTA